jgi:hypothetical protein
VIDLKILAASRRGRALILLAALAGTAAVAQQSGGGTAVYWMTAETNSGMTAMAAGGTASMIRAMAGGGSQAPYSRNLQLQLGTGRRAPGEPNAEHLPPSGLQAGASLPLVTPQTQPATGTSTGLPEGYERPKGRMLIYWGCGDRARPGQPLVIDYATLGSGKAPAIYSALNLKAANPPAPGRQAIYGEWPNQRSRASVPAAGSLLGEHVVRGNYTPDIRFTVGQGQDFLAPVVLTSSQTAANGAVPLAWQQVGGARAWFASTMGSAGGSDLVMWSSSETQVMPMLMAHLDPQDIVRLLQQRVLMPASATSCTVPAEVAKAAPQSMLNVTAFGGDANFSHPARPAKAPASWRPEWTVKLRIKSAYTGLLGQDMAALMAGRDPGDGEGGSAPAPVSKKKTGKNLLRRGLGSIFGQ